MGKVTRKPPTSPRPIGGELSTTSSTSYTSTNTRKSERTTHSDGKKHGPRVRSASTGRDKKSELQARYWAFLLGNLQRAIDELYCACEAGECLAQCQEVVLVLDNYTRDFHALIHWFRVKWRYEATTPPQRPQALAWDIRKSSPPGTKFRSSVTNLSPKSDKMFYDLPRSNETPTPPRLTPTPTGQIISESSTSTMDQLSLGLLKTVEVVVPSSLKDNPIAPSIHEVAGHAIPQIQSLSPRSPSPIPPPNSSHSSPANSFFFNDEMKPMMDQASQTDLELCIQDKDCIRFLPAPQANLETTQTQPVDVSPQQVVEVVEDPPKPTNPITTNCPPKLIRSRTVTEVRRTSRPTLSRSSTSLRNVQSSRQPRIQQEFYKNTKGQSFNKRQGFSNSFNMNSTSSISTIVNYSNSPNQESNGSTTSLNSSGSWADRVRRKKSSIPNKTNISTTIIHNNNNNVVTSRRSNQNVINSNKQQQKVEIVSNSQQNNKNDGDGEEEEEEPPASVSVEVLNDDDSQGWETVKGRSRWRPVPRNHTVRLRFQQPTAAVSLPALALAEVALRPPNINNTISSKSKSTLKTNSNRTRASSNVQSSNKAPLSKSTNISINHRSSSTTITNRRPSSAETNRPINNKNNNTILNKSTSSNKNITNKLTTKTDEEEIIQSEQAICDGLSSSSLDILDNNLTGDELLESEALNAEEAKLREEIHALESAEIEGDTETDETETDGEATVVGEEITLRKACSSHIIQVSLEEESHSFINLDPNVEEEQMTLEDRYENMLEGLSWAERIDALEQLKALVARHPGRAQELHQKLSSPSRRRGGGPTTLADALKRFQEKQAHAKAKRESLKLARSKRLRELLNRVEEVKAAQARLVETRRERLEEKLRRAEANRLHHLRGIVRKAHDEEEKAKEIAFINELEAQNKRHDLLAQSQEHDQRVHGLQESRQRRHEAQAAKEAAVEERRRRLAAERQQRIERMQEKRRTREERVGRIQQEKEKERQEAAREKARDREERRSALQAAQLATQSELQKKIQQKQVDTARRHEESLEHIRQRALESSLLRGDDGAVTPRLTPYDTVKLCKLCNVLIGSEVYLLSHVRGRKHHEAVQASSGSLPSSMGISDQAAFDLRHIVDAPADAAAADPRLALDKERQQALRKRCKKIRVRMNARSQELELKLEPPPPAKVDSQHKGRLHKCLKDIDKLLTVQNKQSPWPAQAVTTLDRALGEMNRILAKKNTLDQLAFQSLGGFLTLGNLLSLALDNSFITNSNTNSSLLCLPPKSFVSCCSTFHLACAANQNNSKYVLCTRHITIILDVLVQHLAVRRNTVNANNKPDTPDAVAEALFRLATLVVTLGGDHSINKTNSNTVTNTSADVKDLREDPVWVRRQDVISYSVAVGVVDRLATHCAAVRDPIDSEPAIGGFLLAGLEFLTALANSCLSCSVGSGNGGGSNGGSNAAGVREYPNGGVGDPTQLVPTFRVTELVGAVSMLYGMLLHQGAPPRGNAPEDVAPHAIAVCQATFRLLAASAKLDLQMFQSVLGAEGISLQFRHIASHLLWLCSKNESSESDLLKDLIRVVGYFAVGNTDNQMMLQSGSQPTVLQQLCSLPFSYFIQPSKSVVLLPTLLACCNGNARNRAVLEEELSYQLLEDFAKSETGRCDRLVNLVYDSEARQR